MKMQKFSTYLMMTVLLMNSTLGVFIASADSLSTVQARVNQIQATDPLLPSGVSEQKGMFGTIIANVFDTAGRIKVEFLGNLVPGLSTNYVPRWNGTNFINSAISDNGTTVVSSRPVQVNSNLRVNGTNSLYLQGNRLYGDNGATLYHYSNSTTNSQMEFKDSNNVRYGLVYGDSTGGQFGLLDGDAQWSYLAAKDNFTDFRINNASIMRLLSSGNVGIGTTAPAYKLEVSGTTKTSDIVYGNGDSRTQTRNDAGLQGDAGAKSGFFETSAPVNYPTGASGWWHMIDVRHSNTSNNYALQIAGSFFDQNLYFRKTNGSATTGWNKVVTENSAGNVGIGTSSPTTKLQVSGSTRFTGNVGMDAGNEFDFGREESYGGTDVGGADYGYIRFDNDNNSYNYWGDSTENSAFIIGTQNDGKSTVSDVLVFKPAAATINDGTFLVQNGNMGIGVASPAYKLDVTGDINMTGNVGIGTGTPRIDMGVNLNTDIRDATGYGLYSNVTSVGPYTANRNYYGTYNVVTNSADNSTFTSTAIGSYNYSLNTSAIGSGTKNLYGSYNYARNNVAGSTVTNAYGGYFTVTNSAGSITNGYGVYIGNVDGAATTTYGLYQSDAAGKNYFAGSVGIGNNSPSEKLSVTGNISVTGDIKANRICDNSGNCTTLPLAAGVWNTNGANIYNGNSGNVGIGTTAPAAKLQVDSGGWPTIAATNSTGWATMAMRGNQSQSLVMHYGGDTTNEIRFGRYASNMSTWEANVVRIDMDAPDTSMYLNGSGNMGIGTGSPGYKLDVAGDARTNRLRLNSGYGLYSEAYGTYFVPWDANYWYSRSDHGIAVQKKDGTNEGWLYHDGGGSFGLLASNGSWNIRTWAGGNELYGTSYANDFRPNIIYDRNDTNYYVDPNGTTRLYRFVTGRMGTSGEYNSTQVQGIWSIGNGYRIDEGGNTFGNQYGLVYSHTNAGASNSRTGMGHAIYWTSNGAITAGVSMSSGRAIFDGGVNTICVGNCF